MLQNVARLIDFHLVHLLVTSSGSKVLECLARLLDLFDRLLQTYYASKRPSCGAASWAETWPWWTAGRCRMCATVLVLMLLAVGCKGTAPHEAEVAFACRDAFFACAQSPKGYSGTATYVRSALALPCAAEEGLSGLCAAAAAAGGGASIHPALAERFAVEELQVGRCCCFGG